MGSGAAARAAPTDHARVNTYRKRQIVFIGYRSSLEEISGSGSIKIASLWEELSHKFSNSTVQNESDPVHIRKLYWLDFSAKFRITRTCSNRSPALPG